MSFPVSEEILKSDALRRYHGIKMLVPAGPTRGRLTRLRGAPWYMTVKLISELSGISPSTLCQIAAGHRGEGRGFQEVAEVHRDTEAAVLGVRPVMDSPERGGGQVPPLGARRRLQALAAAGYPLGFLSVEMSWGVQPQPVHRFVTGKSGANFVMHSTHLKACELYAKYESTDPMSLGLAKISVSRAKSSARKNGYAPPQCWDPDTIDDPQAIAEWTGACGTPQGIRIHHRDGIPACPPCLATRQTGGGMVRLDPAKLLAAREARGLSLKELGAVLGVHDSTIHYWETGRSAPRDPERYLVALDITPEDAM